MVWQTLMIILTQDNETEVEGRRRWDGVMIERESDN